MYKGPLDFFNAIFEAYNRSEAVFGEPINHFYRIGNLTIRLSFAGPSLIPYFTPALKHLATEPVSNPSLTVLLFDSKSTRTSRPTLPWQEDQYMRRGEILNFNSQRIHISRQWDSNALNLLDKSRNLAIYWINDSKDIPYWDTGAPLLNILQLWLSDQEIQMVHGAAVGSKNGGVLLAGKGGSGKSTAALSCLKSELLYAGDDYVLLVPHPVPTIHNIYCTGKINPRDIGRFQFLSSAISNSDHLHEEKALYFLNKQFSEKIITRFPLRAVLIPRITDRLEPSLSMASTKEALAALVPSTIIQLPFAGKEACQLMARVVNQLPNYYFNLGRRLGNIPQVISNLLSSLN